MTKGSASSPRNRAAIFLDRDGTVIVERHYLSDPEEVELLPGVGEALRSLAQAGWMLVMVTNQSGVERGYFGLADVRAVNQRVQTLLSIYGAPFDAIYICPHGPDSRCSCRKPAPGMLLSAGQDHAIDLARSILIGDKISDLEAGEQAGSRAILVTTGHGAASADAAKAHGWTVVPNLTEALKVIPSL